MGRTRICMEHSWARVAAIVLMLGWIMPKSLRAGAVLEAGEIDSSTVKVGAFAVVIYGQGERQPVSEDNQERLVTARGYIQALDWEQGWLILAVERDGWQERIAFDRIQRLVLFGTPSPGTDRDSTSAAVKAGTTPSLSQRRKAKVSMLMDSSSPSGMENGGIRFLAKLAAGTASGIAVATISGISLAILAGDGSGSSGGGSDNPWLVWPISLVARSSVPALGFLWGLPGSTLMILPPRPCLPVLHRQGSRFPWLL